MNYFKIYGLIICKAFNEDRKKIKGSTYYEKHHILPKCMGGSNKKDNLILLTAREHFICHKLLVEMYPNDQKIFYAYYSMFRSGRNQERDYYISSKEYERMKIKLSNVVSARVSGENHPMYGIDRKGSKAPNFGKKGDKATFWQHTHSEETKIKMSLSQKGIPKSEEHKFHMSENHADFSGSNSHWFGEDRAGEKNSFYNKHHSEESLIKMRKPKPEEHKNKISETLKNKPILFCIYCGQRCQSQKMINKHFENCNKNPNRIVKRDKNFSLSCPYCGL
jgi:hypothetical protein